MYRWFFVIKEDIGTKKQLKSKKNMDFLLWCKIFCFNLLFLSLCKWRFWVLQYVLANLYLKKCIL